MGILDGLIPVIAVIRAADEDSLVRVQALAAGDLSFREDEIAGVALGLGFPGDFLGERTHGLDPLTDTGEAFVLRNACGQVGIGSPDVCQYRGVIGCPASAKPAGGVGGIEAVQHHGSIPLIVSTPRSFAVIVSSWSRIVAKVPVRSITRITTWRLSTSIAAS